MKKADLSVGMVVEDRFGSLLTVIAVGGWRKTASYDKGTKISWDGKTITADGQRHPEGRGILVAPESLSSAHVTSPAALFPVGTLEARQTMLESEADAATKVATAAADSQRMVFRELWGDRSNELLDLLMVPLAGPLTDEQRAILKAGIICGTFHGET